MRLILIVNSKITSAISLPKNLRAIEQENSSSTLKPKRYR